MKLSSRLLKMIDDADIDEGELLLKVMLDPDSTTPEMEEAIFDFLMAAPDYEPPSEYIVYVFIENHLLEDDEDDFTIDEGDDDELNIDDDPEATMSEEDEVADNSLSDDDDYDFPPEDDDEDE